MGNCQAIDAAALVIQHPSGRIERMYWPVAASEVMRLNPGHYVSLIIPLPSPENPPEQKTVQFTRVKLLRPSDTLALGHAYRLVTTQEVMKVLRAKKYAKMKKQQPDTVEKSEMAPEKKSSDCEAEKDSELDKEQQAKRLEGHRTRTSSSNPNSLKSKSWRPSLQSISETASYSDLNLKCEEKNSISRIMQMNEVGRSCMNSSLELKRINVKKGN